ncbi:MAG: hypothetical protein H5T86_16400, partial [Armatimonadetes bacterium]|nr:hypothetical protein [Armatimonadota bacterium]
MAARAGQTGVVVVLLLVLLAAAFAQTSVPVVIDRESLDQASAELARRIWTAVEERGGDLERQHLRLVVAFSTSHFASDPVNAQATRELATRTAAKLLVRGDWVRVYSWEIGLWQFSEWAGRDIEIISDAWAKKISQLASLWPITPRSGSIGGHDTERAIAEIAEHIGSQGGLPTNTVMLLLAPSAASMDPPGQRGSVWGQNHPRYVQALRRLNLERLPPVDRSGACGTVLFQAYVPEKGKVTGVVQYVIVVPARFVGHSLSPPVRSERLSGLPGHAKPERASAPGFASIVIILLLVVVVGVGIAMLVRRSLLSWYPAGWYLYV